MKNSIQDGSDERKFLHDIAGPVATAMFLLDAILESFQGVSGVSPSDVDQLRNALGALEKAKKMLEDRRAVLIQRGVPSARS
ncbi:MAG: hypothetical protein AABZ55_05060 [Bdellovibrionota bacterium]